jgi:hypothetical protein
VGGYSAQEDHGRVYVCGRARMRTLLAGEREGYRGYVFCFGDGGGHRGGARNEGRFDRRI